MNIDDIQKGKLYLDTVWSKVESMAIRCISKTENNAYFVIEDPGKNGDRARRHFNRIECDRYVCKHPKENYSNESPTPLSAEETDPIWNELNQEGNHIITPETGGFKATPVVRAINAYQQQTDQLRQQVEEWKGYHKKVCDHMSKFSENRFAAWLLKNGYFKNEVSNNIDLKSLYIKFIEEGCPEAIANYWPELTALKERNEKMEKASDRLIKAVTKKIPNVSIPEDEELYNALHDLKQSLNKE